MEVDSIQVRDNWDSKEDMVDTRINEDVEDNFHGARMIKSCVIQEWVFNPILMLKSQSTIYSCLLPVLIFD
jgi:hypothetical protein